MTSPDKAKGDEMLAVILFLVFGVVILPLLYVVCMAGDTADTIERRDDEH